MSQTKNNQVVVLGDIMLDKYLEGKTQRISPEAPVPVLNYQREYTRLGGAANVAANLKALEMDVCLAGMFSNDTEGLDLSTKCQDSGIELIQLADHPTTHKTRIISGNQQLLRIDSESFFCSNEQIHQEISPKLKRLLESTNWVVLSDYNKGSLYHDLLGETLKLDRNWKVLIDPKGIDWEKYSNADILSPNFKEFCEYTGIEFENSHEALKDSALDVIKKLNLQGFLITRGSQGMSYFSQSESFELRSEAREVFDVSGAGDTVLASFTYALAKGESTFDALHIANVAAGVAVSKPGTSVVRLSELQSALRQGDWNRKLISAQDLFNQVKDLRTQGKKIVFTNGCFDVIHRGHIQYLNEAAKQGDVLFLGLNSDQSVKRLKGETRPVNSQEDRAFVLGNLSSVDWICVFDSDTPEDLIRTIKPDVLVKGGDYTLEQVVGREWANEVVLLDFVEGYSSSNTLKRLSEN